MTDTDPPESTAFYQLLFSDPIQTLNDNKIAANATTAADYADSFYGPNPPKLLCFGGYKREEEAICSEITAASFKQMVCQSESSSASSTNNNSSSANPNCMVAEEAKRAWSNPVNDVSGKPAAHAKPRARPKPVRKEKIGERIATLQQLVSPFGKTDTASVLHEAFCYIKFLHDQVQVLSSPYLQISPNQGMRDMGLCLVPVAYTAEVASTNGADFWAPAGMESSNKNMG